MRFASLRKMRASPGLALLRQAMGLPFIVAPPPSEPPKTSPRAGMRMMPATGAPSCSTPRSMPKIGTPQMKERVPSIGSTIQVNSASAWLLPNSSPKMPWSGKRFSIAARIAFSVSRSAMVTGLSSALSSMATPARK